MKSKEDKETIPISVWDLDKLHIGFKSNNLMISYEQELDQRFPGFSDISYRKRRNEITQIAYNYKHGDCIPRIEYTQDELNNWKLIYTELKAVTKKHACKEYLQALEIFEKENIYSRDFIPQLEDVSRFIQRLVGYRLRPVGGQISVRDFFEILSFRMLPSTQYLRHPASPQLTPEPDIVHELLGHLPLVLNRDFADFFHEVGVLSIGISDDDINKLLTMVWWTVEWGLCCEGDEIKAWGGAILSSYGELLHAASGKPELRKLSDLKKKEISSFTFSDSQFLDDKYQPVYYVAESLEHGKQQVLEFCKQLKRPFKYRYEPFTQSIERVDEDRTRQKIKMEIEKNLDLLFD